MALTKISTAMISQSAAAVDLNVDAGTFYVDTTNNRVGVGGKTDPDTPLHVIGTATATTFAGSGASLTDIPNSALTNSSITINSTAVSLGGSLTLTTANIGENTNLYYTDARADARIAAADTDDLSEGSSNLYYTDARVDARVSGGSLGNITTTGYIRGPATFTLDPAAHGDDTGTVVIAGNLQVDGTTTTINSTTLTVDDKNITLASGSANAAAASGAGFTVDIGTGTLPSITYDGTNDEWDFNKPLNVTGSVTSTTGFTTAANTRVQASSGMLFLNGPSALTFEVGAGSEKMRLTSTGLGIGTQVPTAVLDVVGPAARPTSLAEVDTGSTARFRSDSSNADSLYIAEAASGALIQVNDGATNSTTAKPLALQPFGGNVGIGTDSPQDQLHVLAPINSGIRLQTPTANNSFGAENRIDFHMSNEVSQGTGNPAARIASYLQRNNNGYGIKFGVRFDSSTFNSAAMTLSAEGNVGIGTTSTSPGDKLTIEGSGAQVLSIYSTDTGSQSTAKTFINLYGENTNGDKRLQGQIASAPGHNASNAGELHFSTNNSSSALARRMTIREDGNVGIGTTSPAYKLALESTATGLTHNLKLNKSSTTGDYAEIAFQLWDGAGTGLNTFGGSGTSRPSVVLRAVNEATNSAAGAFVVGTFTGGANNTTLTEKFRIASNGNVGIGATGPSYKLDIDGNNYNGATGTSIRIKDHSSNVNDGNIQSSIIFTGRYWSGDDNTAVESKIAGLKGAPNGNTGSALGFFTQTFGSGGSVERMRIDNAGRVTMPYQPAFRATGNGAWQAIGSNVQAPFNVAPVNIGGHYSTANKRFTAPVAGQYYFAWHTYNDNTYSNSIVPRVNGASQTGGGGDDIVAYQSSGVTGDLTISASIILTLAASDYVDLACRGGHSSRIYMPHSQFSGYLIG